MTEYLDLLALFHRAVKSADPGADVVLGGCPPGVFPAPETHERSGTSSCGSSPRVSMTCSTSTCTATRTGFPDIMDDIRAVMRAPGRKPILVGEYNGPLLFEYPEVMEHLADVMNSGAMTPWHTLHD